MGTTRLPMTAGKETMTEGGETDHERQLQEQGDVKYTVSHTPGKLPHYDPTGGREHMRTTSELAARTLQTESSIRKFTHTICTLNMSGNQTANCLREGVCMLREDRYSPTLVDMYTTPTGPGLGTNRLDRQRRLKTDQGKESEPPTHDYLRMDREAARPGAGASTDHYNTDATGPWPTTQGKPGATQCVGPDWDLKSATRIDIGEIVGSRDMSCITGQTRTKANDTQRGPLNHLLDHLLTHPQGCQLPHQRAHSPTKQPGYRKHVQPDSTSNTTTQEEDGHIPLGLKSVTTVLAARTEDNTITYKDDE